MAIQKEKITDRPAITIKACFNEALSVGKGQSSPYALHNPTPQTTKKSLTLRLDEDIIAAYRATGKGWQSRINQDLRKIAGIKDR